jgi:hypothetical protein
MKMRTQSTQTSHRTLLPPFEQVEKNIVLAVVLSFFTFGIYNLFWQAHQMRVWNKLLGWEKYSFWRWFLLSLITFGFYHIYHEYLMGTDLVLIQRRLGADVSEQLPLISVVLAAVAVPFVADAIQQYELHRLYEPEVRNVEGRVFTP